MPIMNPIAYEHEICVWVINALGQYSYIYASMVYMRNEMST